MSVKKGKLFRMRKLNKNLMVSCSYYYHNMNNLKTKINNSPQLFSDSKRRKSRSKVYMIAKLFKWKRIELAL